jgi:retron-type reverse transcriptase
MGRIQFSHSYDDIISIKNLLGGWKEFVNCKRCKIDVSEFTRNLFANIQELHQDLKDKTYSHGEYCHFKIKDPKPRDIHKALVRDRLLHHAIYRQLYPFFDRTFISDSYSCRNEKGTHKGFKRFSDFAHRASFGHTKTIWVLKCDVRKFFASIDHQVLFNILDQYIPNKDIIWLMRRIVSSFRSTKEGIGLPLGNLTSQLFVNIYMNEFDQFIKHKLKAKWYIRYADDFVVLRQDRKWLESILANIRAFLEEKLHLTLHPDKVSIRTFAAGVDFLGWVHFPGYRVFRTATKKRMFRNLEYKKENTNPEKLVITVGSYLGMLSHGNAYKLSLLVKTRYMEPIGKLGIDKYTV